MDGMNKNMDISPRQDKAALSWQSIMKKKMTLVPPSLAKFRPAVGKSCHQCTPDSLHKKLGQRSSFGFRNLLSFSETQTRYRGWLVRRACCLLSVSSCKVYASPESDRLERVCQSNSVKEVLSAEHKEPEGQDDQGHINRLSPYLPLIKTCISAGFLRFIGWVMLKMMSSVFGNIEVNLNHLSALHTVSKEGSPLVYVHVRQSTVDCALIPLVLFCHNLRVPYTVCPLQVHSSIQRSILQKVGVLLPPCAQTEHEAETDSLYSPLMRSLLCELLREGQAISVGVSAQSGQGGQWLAHIRQLIKEGSVLDVNLVPVGISYDCVPKTNVQVTFSDVCRWLCSVVWRRPAGSVRIHFAQPFSLKEMCQSGRCRVDEWLPLQDLLLPVILNNRTLSVSGRRRMSWLLPSHYASDPEEPTDPERDLSIAIILHLLHLATSCMAVMSASLVSSLLLYKHCKGVNLCVLCRDVSWLTEELLFRNKDVGFGGSLAEVVHYSLSLLAPHVIIAAVPSRGNPFIVPRPTLAATLHLSLQAQVVINAFISEAVGACAVSAMLSEVAASGVSSHVRSDWGDGGEVKVDLDFDVVLCQSELTERALQLCHLLPPGFIPPCQSLQSFAVEAIDSLVRCSILIMEEVPRDVPICDFWKKQGLLTWTTSDDPDQSDSDCEEQDLYSYKISQPSHCPKMLLFLCSLLAGHLRALCWTITGLEFTDKPLPEAEFLAKIHTHLCDTANTKKQHYESCSEEAAHTALRTLIDLGVISEQRREDGLFLSVSPLFLLLGNRQKLQRFIKQYLYN